MLCILVCKIQVIATPTLWWLKDIIYLRCSAHGFTGCSPLVTLLSSPVTLSPPLTSAGLWCGQSSPLLLISGILNIPYLFLYPNHYPARTTYMKVSWIFWIGFCFMVGFWIIQGLERSNNRKELTFGGDVGRSSCISSSWMVVVRAVVIRVVQH